MSQMKEQGKNLQDQINEEKIGNRPEKEFRVMIVKMIQNLRNRMEARIENKPIKFWTFLLKAHTYTIHTQWITPFIPSCIYSHLNLDNEWPENQKKATENIILFWPSQSKVSGHAYQEISSKVLDIGGEKANFLVANGKMNFSSSIIFALMP